MQDCEAKCLHSLPVDHQYPAKPVICSYMNLPEPGRRLNSRGDHPGERAPGMRVAMLGSGGLGGVQWALLAYGGHLEAMQQRGLRIRI